MRGKVNQIYKTPSARFAGEHSMRIQRFPPRCAFWNLACLPSHARLVPRPSVVSFRSRAVRVRLWQIVALNRLCGMTRRRGISRARSLYSSRAPPAPRLTALSPGVIMTASNTGLIRPARRHGPLGTISHSTGNRQPFTPPCKRKIGGRPQRGISSSFSVSSCETGLALSAGFRSAAGHECGSFPTS